MLKTNNPPNRSPFRRKGWAYKYLSEWVQSDGSPWTRSQAISMSISRGCVDVEVAPVIDVDVRTAVSDVLDLDDLIYSIESRIQDISAYAPETQFLSSDMHVLRRYLVDEIAIHVSVSGADAAFDVGDSDIVPRDSPCDMSAWGAWVAQLTQADRIASELVYHPQWVWHRGMTAKHLPGHHGPVVVHSIDGSNYGPHVVPGQNGAEIVHPHEWGILGSFPATYGPHKDIVSVPDLDDHVTWLACKEFCESLEDDYRQGPFKDFYVVTKCSGS